MGITGKITEIRELGNGLVEIGLEEIHTKESLTLTVGETSEIEVGNLISTYTTVSRIANTDFDHVYPEGTLGTF